MSGSTGEVTELDRGDVMGQTRDGVWVVYSVDAAGFARVEQVYRTELDALRAHKNNTDPSRSVRFLPYGVSVGVLDTAGRARGWHRAAVRPVDGSVSSRRPVPAWRNRVGG